MGTLVFILVLSILVIVHEYGHLAMAKALGVRVERFAIGFGPKIFSFKKKDTDYAVCLIPLGGYVKMAGDERADYKGGKEEFFSKPVGHRALIVLFGPVVNYLFAFICFCLVFMIGYPALGTNIKEAVAGYPAHKAGFLAGDKILAINDAQVHSWEDVQKFISRSLDDNISFLVDRKGEQKTLVVQSTQDEVENVFGQKIRARVVGIKPQEEIVLLRYHFLQSIVYAAEKLVDITWTTYKALYLMITGAMSTKDGMTGPIGIFFIIKKAAELGFTYVLYIMAVISASLAIFNLLPLPVLDGGHLLLFGIEKIKGKPLPAKTEEIVYKIGLSLIICLAVFIFYNDFVRYGVFDKIFTIKDRLGF